MRLSHAPRAVCVSFYDPNLVSGAGLVPTMRLARSANQRLLLVTVDLDDGFSYAPMRGLNALIATLATAATAPTIVAQRLREGFVRINQGRTG